MFSKKTPKNLVVSRDGSSCTLYNTGVVIPDISRSGTIAFWNLTELLKRGRVALVWHPDALSDGDNQLYQQVTLFILLAHYQITPEFYKHLQEGIESQDLTLHTKLIGLSRSSLLLQTDIIDSNSDRVLAWLRLKYVCVDRNTRKSVVLPKWFVTKYGHIQNPDAKIEYSPPEVPNRGVFTKSYTINPSDTDFNGHTSNAVYYRMFFDAATEASLKERRFPVLTGDICSYNVRESGAIYLKECRMWDEIEVNVWQDANYTDTLHCCICRGQTELFKASTKFYIKAKL